MGARRISISSTTDIPLVTTNETVVATISGISTNRAGQSVSISGSVTITTGANTTGITLRVRRDSIAGAIVGEPTADSAFAAAGQTETHSISVQDATVGEVSGKTYVLTAQQIAATANGNATMSTISADMQD